MNFLTLLVLFASFLSCFCDSDMKKDIEEIKKLYDSWVNDGWDKDDIDIAFNSYATEFTIVSPNTPMIRRTAESDEKEIEMIKDQIYQEILLYNGKCELLDVIPSPPVYYGPSRCSKYGDVKMWPHTDGVNVFRKENGKWKVSFLAFYATPKLPASADE